MQKMIQPQHLNLQQEVNSKVVVIFLVLLFGSYFLLFLSFRLQLYLYRIKLTESKEKIKFLERRIIKVKKVSTASFKKM